MRYDEVAVRQSWTDYLDFLAVEGVEGVVDNRRFRITMGILTVL